MKKICYPLHKTCQFFDYCTSKEGENRKNCGYCPLHPRATRFFAVTLIARILIPFALGLLARFLFKG